VAATLASGGVPTADAAAAAAAPAVGAIAEAASAPAEVTAGIAAAQQSAAAAQQGAAAAQALAQDPVGGLLGLTGAAASAVAPIAGAQQAAQAVGAAASAGQAISGAASSMSARSSSPSPSPSRGSSPGAAADAASAGQAAWGGAQRDDIVVSLEIDGVSDVLLGVRDVTLDESVSTVSVATIEMRCDGPPPEVRSLLNLDCVLSIGRGVQARSFRGVILHAQLRGSVEGPTLVVQVSPALAYLRYIVDTRIFQDMSVLEVVQALFDEKLGPRSRVLRDECQRTYPKHEYLVQYDESCLSFVQRLLESEGIHYYFDHEQDHEVLVLADTVDSSPTVRSDDDGAVPYAADAEQADDHEAVTSAEYLEQVGATDVVVSGYDWTNPTLDVKHALTGNGTSQPALEIYDQTDAVRYHEYADPQYGSNSAELQAKLRNTVLQQQRQHWRMQSTVVTMEPGRLMTLSGAPDPTLDTRYLVLSVRTRVIATEGSTGSIDQSLEAIPTDILYVPPRRTPIPAVHGMETATVVGPESEEIHTDEHGRIKVQFHWDRLGERNERSSCWIRVAQMWGGAGWGTFFLPRIGMEVIVSFLGGHADRPVVIGTLYNGTNGPPYTLPDDKTKTTIKTNSSPGGDGFNELRFEDAAGSEEVFIQAQKDMNETIKNNHSTSVGANQTLSVGGNRTHSVSKHETITVTGSQKISITGSGTGDGQTIKGAQLDITGKYKLDADDEIMVQAPNKITFTVGESTIVMEPGKITLTSGGKSVILLDAEAKMTSSGASYLKLNADAKLLASGAGEVFLDANAMMKDASGSEVHLDSAKAKLSASTGAKVELTANAAMQGQQATMTGDVKAAVSGATEALLSGGGGTVKATPAGVDAAGGAVNITGQGMTTIAGGVVKIN